MATPGCAALNVTSLGPSHFSATALDRDDTDVAGPAALAFGDALDIGEDALHLSGR